MSEKAIQDEPYMQGNHCFGCGPENAHGLRIKSYWDGEESVCTFQPEPHQCAGWPHVTFGGLIANIIDCHATDTAIAEINRNLAPGEPPVSWCASVNLNVDFLRPTPVDKPFSVRARIVERDEKKMRVACSVLSDGQETARGEVVAVRVPAAEGPGR